MRSRSIVLALIGTLTWLAAEACGSSDPAPAGDGPNGTGGAVGKRSVVGRRADPKSSVGGNASGAGSSEASAGGGPQSERGGAAGDEAAGRAGGDRADAGSEGGGGRSGGGGSAGAAGLALTDAGIAEADVAPSPKPWDSQGKASFPFPQNRRSKNCIYPTVFNNEDVWRAYVTWKADTVTADGANGQLRVKRPAEPGLEVGSTVSEGIAYGMMIAVYMNDQAMFDAFWKYEQMYLDGCGLMDWYISADGTKRLGTGAALDADEDMAWALVMASKQWGGKGTLAKSYLDTAKEQIDKLWKCEILDGKLPRPGDGFGDWNHLNISYFAPSYYRVFASVSGNAGWGDANPGVVTTVYDIISRNLNATSGNVANGLVGGWSNSEGVADEGGAPGKPGNYQYDSARTPFRIGLDACFYGEPRAVAYLAKTSSFFQGIGAANVADGYKLDGTPAPENPGKQSATFLGAAAVGAMSGAAYQPFLDEAYGLVATGKLLCGGVYYDESWTVMSLLMMTGSFLDYTQVPDERGRPARPGCTMHR